MLHVEASRTYLLLGYTTVWWKTANGWYTLHGLPKRGVGTLL